MADSAEIPLIGRSIELDRIRAATERAAAAAGSTLLLAGEEGIGKSRLAAEALVLARQRGFLTLKGTAYALHTDLAYAPVHEAIGPFLAGLPAGHLSRLVRGLPDLSRLFGNLSLAPPAPLGWLAEIGFQPPEIHELLDDFPLKLIIARKSGGRSLGAASR